MMKKLYTLNVFIGKCSTKFICLGIFALSFLVENGFGQTIISWNFTSGNTPNTNLPGGTTTLTFNTGGTNGTSGCTGSGFSTNNWNVNEYLQIVAPTTGYNITTVTFNVQSSGTGPGNFKIQYSSTGTSGTFTDLPSGTFTSGNGNCVARSVDFTSINAIDNNSNTVFRFVFTGGEADGSPASGDAQAGGTFRIDDLVINGSAIPSNSSSSNIIRNASFTEPTNIAYAATQENSNLTTSNSLEVAQFTIQDGGGSSDADALATILNSITFTVSNHTLLRRLALYDGNTEVSTEQVTGSTVTFSGLTLSAADNSSKTFSIRASFAATVTDNQQFSFTVSSATASGSGSGFAAANAGAAASSITGDANRIEVTASKLLFVQQPSNTATNTSMSPAVTVEATDANNNRDLDYVTSTTITSTGTLTGSPVATTPSAGLATFSSLTHTAAGTSLTLTAASGALTNVVSNTFNITNPQPEINVRGNNVDIVDGDITPTTNDHTDFGNIGLGSSLARTFTIQNTGTATLNISGTTPFVVVSGTNAADFVVTTAPSNTVAAAGSTTFIVTFTPSGLGTRNATLTINSNDADEAVYNFDITGTGTPSAVSDIIATSGYTYNSNIDYTAFQATTITNTSHSIDLFQFDIRDGGVTTDGDALPTIVSAITFNVTNIANIRSAALFRGNTMVNNAPTVNTGAGTIAFSGLSGSNVTAADGSSQTLTLRVSFAATVTDQQQIQVTIANANVTAAGSNTSSLFAAFTSVVSSTTSNRNRIVVTADRLRFGTQPTNGSAGVNLAAFTIRAVDALGSVDIDAVNSVALTTSGTSMTSSTPYTLVNGTVSISDVQFSAGQTNITLTATTTGLSFENVDVSNTFNIETVVANSYRTTSNGTWPSGTATWERFVNGSWTVATPSASVTNILYIRHTITSNGSFAATGGVGTKITVQTGGTFNANHVCTLGELIVESGGKFTITNPSVDILATTGTVTVESGGTVTINSATLNNGDGFWGGIENFKAGSNLEILSWDWNDNTTNERLIGAANSISTNAAGYYFGNLTINVNLDDNFNLVALTGTQKLCQNDLTISNASASNFVVLGIVNSNIEIGGNLIVQSGSFRFTTVTGSSPVYTIGGNLIVNGGSANLNPTSNAQFLTVNILGNISVASSGSLISSDADSKYVFSNSLTQTLSIASTSSLGTNVDFEIASGATVQLINQNLALTNASNRISVLTGGTLEFNGFDITGAGDFVQESGATLKVTAANGINATGNNTGNIQNTGTRTFSLTGNFHFVGNSSPQSTGTAIATSTNARQIVVNKTNATDIVNLTQSTGTSSSLQIINGTLVETASANIVGGGTLTMSGGTYKTAVLNTTVPQLSGAYTITGGTIELNGAGAQELRGGRDYTNLTFSNSGTKTLSTSIGPSNTITGTVTISDAVIVDAANRTFGGAATNLTMTGTSQFKTTGTGTRPTMGGTYTLGTGTTIEFANTAITTQAIRTSGVTYANVVVSGTSVGTTTGTASINMQSGATLTVKSGATFKTKNLTGFSGAAGTAISSTNNPTIVLESGSTIEYNGDTTTNPSLAAQTITPRDYSNLTIAGDRGSETVTLPTGTIGIANNFTVTAINANYATTGNTINFNGSADQTIPVFGYHHLATGGTGVKSIANDLVLNGGLSVGENTSLQASNYIITPAAANSVTITGTFITSNVNGFSGAANTAINSLNNPGFNLTNGTIVYNAAVEQNVTPRNDYHHVTIRNNSTKLLLGNAVFNGSLNLEDGVFNISGRTLTFQNGNTPLLRTNGTITTNGLTNLVFGTMGNTGGNAFTIPNNLFTSATPTLANFTMNRSNSLSLNNQFFNLIRKFDLQSGNLILPNNYIFTLKSTSILNTALVAPVGGTITYGTGAAFMVERFIPKDITKNSGNGIRAFRDISPGLMPDADIFSTWQEGGINNNGFGTQITGKVGTPGTVDAITGLDLTTSGNPSLYSFNVSLSNGVPSWDNGFTATKNVFASPFKGYRISIRGNRQNNLGINGIGLNNEVILRSRGKLVTGTVRFTKDGVTASNDMSTTDVRLASSTTTSFTMVGNPYASPIDFIKLMDNNANAGIQRSCWVFDPNIGTAGAYVTFNTITGPSNEDGSRVNRFIQPGQAFFIRNNGTTSPVLEIREEDKAVDSVDNLRGVFSEGTVQPLHKIKFTLLKNVSNVFANMDGALLCFKNGFKNARGAEDALKFENTGENIALANNGNYSIEGKAIPTVSDSTVVRIWKMESAAAYQLRIDLTGVSINGLQPILKDRFTKTQTVLPINTVYNYSFTTSADTNSFNNRFTIVYTNTTPLPVAFISLKASQLNANNIIDWKVTESNIQHYTVEYTPQLSSTFSSIATINSNGSGTYQYTHVGATNNSGYYRIKATDYAGAIKYSSVVAIAVQGNNATIQVYPNPVLLSNGLKLAFNAITTDNYTVQLVDNSGKLVYQTNVQHQGSQAIYSLSLPSSISAGNYQLKVIGKQIQHQQAIIIHP